jgi:hypothetical protein
MKKLFKVLQFLPYLLLTVTVIMFMSTEVTPDTHCIGGWVGPRAGLDAEARRKTLYPCLESKPGPPAHS